MFKRKIAILMMSIMLILVGCGDGDDIIENSQNESRDNENLNFAHDVNKDENRSIYDEMDSLVYSVWISNDLNLEEALEEEELPPYSFEEHVKYSGEPLKYRAYVYNDRGYAITDTYFMCANGNMQPFKMNGSEESCYQTITIQAKESKELIFEFDPIYAPYDKEGELEIFSVMYGEYSDELANVIEKNQKNYGAPFVYMGSAGRIVAYIQSNSQKCEKLVEKKVSQWGEASPDTIIRDTSDNFTIGYTFGDAYSKETENDVVNLSIQWNRDKDLYARVLGYGGHQVRFFLVMDGELLPAFNGEYYTSFEQKMGVFQNIKIDSDVLPKEGKHIFYGGIIYNDEEITDIDIVYPCLINFN